MAEKEYRQQQVVENAGSNVMEVKKPVKRSLEMLSQSFEKKLRIPDDNPNDLASNTNLQASTDQNSSLTAYTATKSADCHHLSAQINDKKRRIARLKAALHLKERKFVRAIQNYNHMEMDLVARKRYLHLLKAVTVFKGVPNKCLELDIQKRLEQTEKCWTEQKKKQVGITNVVVPSAKKWTLEDEDDLTLQRDPSPNKEAEEEPEKEIMEVEEMSPLHAFMQKIKPKLDREQARQNVLSTSPYEEAPQKTKSS